MAGKNARAAVVDGLGASNHEPRTFAGWQEFWKERGYLFGEEFRRYVENDLMKREPHPDAKPLGAFSIGSLAN
jgi:hypothetical protein